LNNNSEIVANKNNSWSPQHQHQATPVPSSVITPKHLQTTEEEKQLVKDIIDINNENFMHQSVNHHTLNHQNPANFMIANQSSINGSLVTVTTLGNHNSNFQSGDIRHKILSSQEPTSTSFNSNHNSNATTVASNTPSNGNFVIINNHLSVDYNQQQQQQAAAALSVPTTVNQSSTPGRYICPYCQLNCAKPSVLQKHIRAHTNERPYPCTSCGFAFKTKSNLYKHCR
jgi:hypothetical protein